jgi:uncharacterized damage-inducible protein DinB
METEIDSVYTELIRYNNWANRQVLDACRKLSESDLAAPIPGAYGTLRETLEHIIRAEASYVGRLSGNRPQPSFKWDDKPGMDELAAFAARVGEALEASAQSIHPDKFIMDEMDGKKLRYQALAVFIQIINHGVEHRTNITTVLNLGQNNPPDVDGWGYLWAHQGRFALEWLER